MTPQSAEEYIKTHEVAEVNGELTIVETKYMNKPRKPRRSHLYQATAYAMLAEEKLKKPIRKILLRPSRRGKPHHNRYGPDEKTCKVDD
ncbi:hypothetical protein J7K52_04895 [Candidatus Bathyarchaeota archaeon]|nr:hypothetical protein [Candidatus Bathyarchaeota archaeon]